MMIEHVAIWTPDLERLKDFYCTYFGGSANQKYINPSKNFASYFISFESGARIELMNRPDIPDNQNDTVVSQHQGIIHLAFGVDSMNSVDTKAEQLKKAGYKILNGPRKTGDGYYEFETLDPDQNRLEVSSLWKE